MSFVRSLRSRLARLPPLQASRWGACARHLSSARKADPLRILFCGSDQFSIAHLRALYEEHQRDAALIESIEVVHRPAKQTGRGLQEITEVPVAAVARELSLPTHALDTFRDWTAPRPFNIVVAVSYGLLVPPHIIESAEYGGLNVHPSLLPDLHGPAPLQRALLARDRYTGVSIQTLHPIKFDAGKLIAQEAFSLSPVQALDWKRYSRGRMTDWLERRLAPLGAEQLLKVLRERLFVAPVQEIEPSPWALKHNPPRHAPKLINEERRIDWRTWPSREILLRSHVLGDLYDEQIAKHIAGPRNKKIPDNTRLIYHEFIPARKKAGWIRESTETLLIETCEGHVIWTKHATVAGKPKGNAVRRFQEIMKKREGQAKYIDWGDETFPRVWRTLAQMKNDAKRRSLGVEGRKEPDGLSEGAEDDYPDEEREDEEEQADDKDQLQQDGRHKEKVGP